MMKLDEFVGEEIFLKPRTPFKDGEELKMYPVKLCGVEFGGVWVESPVFTSMMKKAVGIPVETKTPKTPIFFFPYSEIYFLFAGETQLNQGNVE